MVMLRVKSAVVEQMLEKLGLPKDFTSVIREILRENYPRFRYPDHLRDFVDMLKDARSLAGELDQSPSMKTAKYLRLMHGKRPLKRAS